MTNTDSHEPLASFLRCFVERGIQIKRFVTDYSLKIVQAINEGYNVGMPNQSQNFNALITFSTPQIFEAFDYQIISLIKTHSQMIIIFQIITRITYYKKFWWFFPFKPIIKRSNQGASTL